MPPDVALVTTKKPEPWMATSVALEVAASRPCWLMLARPETVTPPDAYEVVLLDAVTSASNIADVVL